jgi:signal transduction histidine kinase
VGGSLQAWIVLNVALYSVAAHSERRRAIAGAVIVAAFVLLFEIPKLVEGGRVDGLAGEWLFLGGVWLLGRWVRQRRQRTAELEHHAADLEADRAALAREAVADERARIAREMHDAVAHSVSVIVLQAGAAEQVLATSPERARESLVTIQDSGREAIGELRRMLGLLRDPVAEGSLAPQPGVGRLDVLLEQVRAAGLPVELTVEGEPRHLPPGIDRSAYRIVQEGLTNTLKHAGPARASVRLRYGERALELEVLDDGRGPARASGGGFGLLGMRERAALYGGVLAADARPDGGYALRARLPLERTGS